MDLRDVLAIAWKRRLIVFIVLATTVGVSAAFVFTQPPLYESSATLALTPDVSQGQGFVASDNLSVLLGTYAETAKSTVTLQRARQILGRPLRAEVNTSTEGGTGILRISAKSTDPKRARDAASAAARAFVESIQGNELLVARIVDPPAVEATPVQPRPPLVFTVAGLLGLFGGLVFAAALETFRRRIETPADVAALTDVPVIGRLPRDRALSRGDAHIIWEDERAVGLQESYRALRTNLRFLSGTDPQVLEVTSADAGEGKSTIVANLGIALSQIGMPTVILDADLRRPTQHLIFGLDNDVGLSTMMALEEREPELLPSGYHSLWVVPSGPVPPDPTEMLHIRLASIIESLRQLDCLVLVDTPPLLPVSDARLVAPHTDGVLLVVLAGAQRPARLQSALEKLDIVDASLRGVILNNGGDAGDGAGGYYEYTPRAEPRPEPAGSWSSPTRVEPSS